MSASDDPRIPGCIDFRLIKRGGFSRVYKAEQPSNDRLVAVKVLSIELGNQKLRKQFEHECQAAGRLSTHPNIITILESGFTDSGEAYLMMDFHAQGSFGDRILERGAMEFEDVLQIGVAIAGALATAHEQNVLHRDVKPENILISDFGNPILADFGIATVIDQLTRTSLIDALTPVHAAPELFESANPSVACDIYSLGSTLYQLLAGRPAFPPRRDEGILAYGRRVTDEPVPPIPRADLLPAVFDLLLRTMSKRPEDRPVSAVALASELQVVQRGLGFSVTEPTLPEGTSGTGKTPRSPPDGLPEFSFGAVTPVRVKGTDGTSAGQRADGSHPLAEAVGGSGPSTPADVGIGSGTIGLVRRGRKTAGRQAAILEKRPRRLSLALGLGVGVGILAAVGLAFVLLPGGGTTDGPGPRPTISTSTSSGPALQPAGGLTASVVANGIYQLHWTDPNPSTPPHRAVVLVSSRAADGTAGTMIGASQAHITATVGGFSAQLTEAGGGATLSDPAGYCFSIGFYDVEASATTSTLLARSSPVCAKPGPSSSVTSKSA